MSLAWRNTISVVLSEADRAGQAQGPEPSPTFVLEPVRGWVPLHLHDLWEYHELLYFFIWRDVKARYRQTVLGVGWAVIQPLMTMVVFSIFFGKLGQIPSNGIPYPIFTFAALVPWQLFANALASSGSSLIMGQSLISKVYFPRLIVPTAAVLFGLVDFGIAMLVLFGLMIVYGMPLTFAILTLPLFILLDLATGLAMGYWLSAANVQYRDVRYIIPFLTQIWLFCTPVAYPASMVPQQWQFVYSLNPMVGVVEGFRWALFGGAQAPGLPVLISAVVVAILLVSGLFYFRRMEIGFADIV